MAEREPGSITVRSFLVPGALFVVFLALAAGAVSIGVGAGWDLAAEVGTGRNRTTAGLGIVIVSVFSILSLLASVALLRRELGYSRTPSGTDD